MTTFEAISIGFREAKAAKTRAIVVRSGTRQGTGALAAFMQRIGGAFLTLCALGAFCYAAFGVADWLGFVVLGFSLLIAEWKISPYDPGSTSSYSNNGRD